MSQMSNKGARWKHHKNETVWIIVSKAATYEGFVKIRREDLPDAKPSIVTLMFLGECFEYLGK